MTILLVGGNGFIGRNLYEYFFDKREYEVEAPSHKELDCLDEKEVLAWLSKRKYDVVINAAVYNPRVGVGKDTYKELEYDLRIFYNFYKYRNMYGKMFYLGSGAEFDKRYAIKNIKETDTGHLIPTSDYGFAKYVINEQIRKSENVYNLRIFGLFGKYENYSKTFISGNICRALKGLPITIRQNVYFDYLYIDDFCTIMGKMLATDLKNKDINVVTGIRIDLFTIAKIIQEVVNPEINIFVCRPGVGLEYTASSERLIQEIGEFKFISMKEAVKKLCKYYENNEKNIDIMNLLY